MRCVAKALALIASCLGSILVAQDVDAIRKSTVAIFCTKPGGRSVQGSGVLVGSNGEVLTAAHVVAGATGTAREVPEIPSDVKCTGSLGLVDETNAKPMIVQPDRFTVDAAVLRFVDPPNVSYQRACGEDEAVIGREILVAGFRGTSETSQISFVSGSISTRFTDQFGVVETTAPTLRGMSGGPVFSRNGVGLVGIVGGGEFAEADGTVSYYGVVSIDRIATATFQLENAARPCFPTKSEPVSWGSGQDPIQLNMRVEEGICVLQSIFGQFNEVDDKVEISTSDSYFHLHGSSGPLGGTHGATAVCYPFD